MQNRPEASAVRPYRCRVCRSAVVAPLLDFGQMPIAHRLLERADAAEETFPFALSICRRCGLMQIADPIDAETLYRGFNYNFSSWKPEPHRADELALILEHAAPSSVAEIGTNEGLFLSELRDAGVKTVAGLEPNPVSGRIARERGLAIYEGMADVATAQQMVADHGRFDAVVSRQVLEHVPGVKTFFETARDLVKDDGYLFIDCPDMEPAGVLGDCSVLWEEHVTYYTRPTLEALLRANGFEPLAVRTYDFSGGALAILSRRSATSAPADLVYPAGVAATERFALRFADYATRLSAALLHAREHGIPAAIYGAGSRACTLTNALRMRELGWSIDDQRERHGKFLPGTRLEIRPSSSLDDGVGPLIVLLAVNNENEARVRANIAERTTRSVHAISVCGPADIWSELERLEAVAGAACAV
jgi:SAM-dependent methyltransferase